MAPYLLDMVAILLVITAFRIGMKNAFGAFGDLKWSLPAVGLLQVVVPLGLALGFLGSTTPLWRWSCRPLRRRSREAHPWRSSSAGILPG